MYKGVKLMGLFWSMKQDPGQEPGRRYMKRIVDTPQEVTLSLFDGHLSWEDIHSVKKYLATANIQRWFKKESIQRVEVNHERLKGTVFIPSGKLELIFKMETNCYW